MARKKGLPRRRREPLDDLGPPPGSGGQNAKYSQKLADEICAWVASGRTVSKFCEQPGKPSMPTIWGWERGEDGVPTTFGERFQKARIDSAHAFVQQAIDVGDDSSRDDNPTAVARARLQAETRKWVATKFLNKVYGDRVTADVRISPLSDILKRISGEPVLPENGADGDEVGD